MRVGAVVGAALGVTVAVTVMGPSAWAAWGPGAYGFDPDARSVDGAVSTSDAETLAAGTTYRSSLPAEGKIYYRLQLDAESNVYAAVTAVPGSGTTVSAKDGVRVSVQNGDGRTCSFDTAAIGTEARPRPLTALGTRDLSSHGGARCQEAGTYYLVVERARGEESSSDAWDLELDTAMEPRLSQAGPTSAPEEWNSASPEAVTGEAVSRRGASGFAGATRLGQGVWRDDIRPGETLYYAVPVDWGQQLHASAELGSSGEGERRGVVARALRLSLYNPVRGEVDEEGVTYDGGQRTAALASLPPVEYTNRYDVADRVSGMRFAGSYYLVVHLSEEMAEEFGDEASGVTLRVGLSGAATAGPGYVGESAPRGVFEATGAGDSAGGSVAGTAADGDLTMRLLAAGGIGTGTALLMGLGVWTVAGRRAAAGGE